MRRLLLVCVLGACGGDATPPPTGPVTAHVTHYDYKVDLDARTAHATVTAMIDKGGDCWTLPFRAASIANAMLDGKPATATTDASSVTVCGTGYRDGATLTLDADVAFALSTIGTSQVGYSITRDSAGNSFYYLVSWVGGCDKFGPCDSRPDQFATYRFDVTHPAGFMVSCPGTLADVGPTETTCDFELPGGPTYSTFAIAAYPAWTPTDKGTWAGVHVTVYDRATTGIADAIDPAYHTGYLTWMQATFGPYPFGSDLRVLTAPTYWSGFEHPGNIILDDGLAHQVHPAYSNATAHVLDHEMAHMWAGDQTTLADTYDFVWKESMAEYLAFVWEDMNSAAVSDTTAYAWKQFGAAAKYYPVPQDKPALFDYYGDVYGPGPLVLFRQLEVLSSRDKVIAAIQSVLGSPHALSVDDLIAALQDKTGLDLTAYADAWIRGSGAPKWPSFALTYTPGSLHVQQTNAGAKPMGCKFHVALQGATVDENQLVEVDTFHNGSDQTIDVTPAFTVTKLVIDPLHECLVFLTSASPREQRRDPWVSDRARSEAF